MFRQRQIFNNILNHCNQKEFTIITGARQTGKTTILRQLFYELQSKNEEVWFINLEREEILRTINADPENLFQYTKRPQNPLYVQQPKPVYVLIDEIQYASNPTNFLKYLYDTYSPNLKIVATGSSAFYIDKKFKDSLAGRKKIFILRTLSFEEFLHFKGRGDLISELQILRERVEYISLMYPELKQLFDEYLTFGGYPSVVLSQTIPDKIDMLYEIRNSFIKRDIIDSKVENEVSFYNLMTLLSSQTGSLLNKNELSKSLRMHNSTVEKYIYVLQKSFHINLIRPLFGNIRKEVVKMPKIYFNDLGLRNSLVNNFAEITIRTDKGQLIENYVYIRLKELYREENIKFWRTTDLNEVDFVVNGPFNQNKAYEVKFSAENIKLLKYKKFISNYPEYPLSFIGYGIYKKTNTLPVLKL